MESNFGQNSERGKEQNKSRYVPEEMASLKDLFNVVAKDEKGCKLWAW